MVPFKAFNVAQIPVAKPEAPVAVVVRQPQQPIHNLLVLGVLLGFIPATSLTHRKDLAGQPHRYRPTYLRPTEVDTQLGNAAKARQKLGWVPEITAHQMSEEIVASGLQEAQHRELLKANGYRVQVSTG